MDGGPRIGWAWGGPRRWAARAAILAVMSAAVVAVVASPASAAPAKWLAVSGGGFHTCGIKADTTLWCWGSNSGGQLGVGDTVSRDTPHEVGGTGWSVVSAGYNFTCGIRDGRRYCWGRNDRGQLGVRDTTNRLNPTRVTAESNNWATVSAGKDHACGMRTSGLVQCWGANGHGQLGIGSTVAYVDRPTTVSGGITWSSISAGWYFTCGLDEAGHRYCWGWDLGRLGLGHSSIEKRFVPTNRAGEGTWRSLDAGDKGACAISDGLSLYCWFTSTFAHVPTQMASGGWLAISVSAHHHCGIALGVAPGPLTPARYCWGLNTRGALGDGTRINEDRPRRIDDGWLMVNAGYHHTCGISTGRYLYCWGGNWDGQLGLGPGQPETVEVPTRVVR